MYQDQNSEVIICRKANRLPRTTYETLAEARVAILLAVQYGQKLFPYNCRICDGIHIRPHGTPAPGLFCKHCKKMGYESEKDARLVAAKRLKDDNVRLKVYKCLWSDEYHLTKS